MMYRTTSPEKQTFQKGKNESKETYFLLKKPKISKYGDFFSLFRQSDIVILKQSKIPLGVIENNTVKTSRHI
jgi:hypothetical protein